MAVWFCKLVHSLPGFEKVNYTFSRVRQGCFTEITFRLTATISYEFHQMKATQQ